MLTNNEEFLMPNMKGWSRSDVEIFGKLTNVEFSFENYGYVISTSVSPKEKINSKTKVQVTLEPKYKKIEETIKENNT